MNHGQQHKGIGAFADRRHPYATEGPVAEEGTIRLGGSDNLDRVVTRPCNIGVGQSGLRLLKPLAIDVVEEVERKGRNKREEEEEDQRELLFNLMATITDDDKREAIRLLLRSLSYAVDEG